MRSILLVAVVGQVAFAETRFVEPPAPGCAAVAACERACTAKGGAACRQLAEWLQDGDGVAKDTKRALSLFAAQCARNDGRACMLLGVSFAQGGEGAPADPARAAELFAKACNAKDAYGCAQLGAALSEGRGVAKDARRGFALQASACDGGVVASCFYAGSAAELDGAFAEAARLDRRGCDGGRADACNNLGKLVERGQGVPANAAQAARLYERGCEGGIAISCANFAGLLRAGRGVAVDKKRASELYRRACQAGDAPSCAM